MNVMARLINTIIAILYFVFGILLYTVLPKFNAVYIEMYSDWGTSDNFFVKLYRVPIFLWPIIFCTIAVSLYLCKKNITLNKLKYINIISTFIFLSVASLFAYATYAFVLPHQW